MPRNPALPTLRLSSFAATLAPDAGALTSAGWTVLAALAYWLGGHAALAMPTSLSLISLFWWPAGLALAAFWRLGPAIWPGVWIGSLLALLGSGAPAWLAALMACGNVAGPMLAVLWMRRAEVRTQLDRQRDAWLFTAFGLGAGMLVSASNNAFWLAAFGTLSWSQFPHAFLHGWLGHLLGALVFGVPLLTLSSRTLARIASPANRAPGIILSLGAVATCLLSFAVTSGLELALLPLVLLPHVLLCSLAARNGLLASSLAALLIGVGAILATGYGLGPLQHLDAQRAQALLWAYLFTLSALPMLVASLVGERTARGALWRSALDASQIGIGEIDVAEGRIKLSSRWLEMLGYSTQAFGHSLQSFWDRVHPDDMLRSRRAFETLRSTKASDGLAECRMLSKDQRWLWFEIRAFVVDRGAGGAPPKLLFLARDIGDRRAVSEHHQLIERLFRYLDEGLLVTDAKHRVLQANPTYARMVGQSIDDITGQMPAMLRASAPGAPEEGQSERMREALRSAGVWRGDMHLRRPDGSVRAVHVTASAVRNADGTVQHHVMALRDVTQSRQQTFQLQRQAHFDELTGLPNRARLTQLMLEALAASERDGTLLTVCYLDLDHFKPVNDQHGHYAGDQLLLRLAERLRRSLRTSANGDDVVARIGGDEFVLLLRAANLNECHKAVERMLHIVGQPFGLSVDEDPVAVTASIGATIFPVDNADAETLLRHADHAMYGAKQAGRCGYQFFDAEHDRLAAARFVELGRVQEALDAQEFCLHYQPKVDMRDGRVMGVEALLRWNHPEQGLLLPGSFLPLIEHTGLGNAVGKWVLQKGIEQLAAWQAMGLDLSISINVSARHLQEPTFASHLARLLEEQDEPVADRLILEVLETTALADIEFTRGLMEECRALGVRFALDDFGTGYSTLTYLKRLPLDMLKIDRSFVINMLNDRQDMAIVEGVIGLSQTFGCTVVAEGVETLEQAQALIEVGCDLGQGNGIAEAMPAGDVHAWVRAYDGMETLVAPLLD
jgi:diguanylate cyclase (GGDEF)-like protein/PAS domain S-box-containing protein